MYMGEIYICLRQIAICAGKTNPYACSITQNPVVYRNKTVQTKSGGKCIRPDVCTDCHDGFHSVGPHCKKCPHIDHCNHARCPHGESECVFCDGDVTNEVGGRAYTHKKDNGRSCQKACSWRPDSTLCYPGTCPEEVVTSCTCDQGFSGHHCTTIDSQPTITINQAKLMQSGDIAVVPDDPNEKKNGTIKWVGAEEWGTIDCSFTATYKAEGNLTAKPLYVTNFTHGITSSYFELQLLRRGFKVGNSLTYNCSSTSTPTTLDCSHTQDLRTWGRRFGHNDTISFKIHASNGGHVTYRNPEEKTTNEKSLAGKDIMYMYYFRFDLVPPTHCVVDDCELDPLNTSDITRNSTLRLDWHGWSDELSGLEKYQYELYTLKKTHETLTEGEKVDNSTDLSPNTTSMHITMKEPGAYSVIFSAFDQAGNFKTARRIILFDDVSKVSKQNTTVLRMVTASSAAGYRFLTSETSQLEVQWKDKFINTRHHTNKWLNAVSPYADPNIFDDNSGERTTSLVPNVNGIVRFEIAYLVSGVSPGPSQNFTPVTSLQRQRAILTVDMSDGQQITITVRAYDVMNMYAEEEINVTKDTSPPRVENLWLTRSDILNISVHNLKELSEMTIEWDAYDYDTGLESVSWRLFDSSTDIVHGQEYVSPQGDAKV
ncbi:hypothetical protein ScPMuIL_015300 [Solemya velum]